MLDQYRRIKKEQKGNILFFRLGDFYEMFADDAIEVSALLNLTLTSRNGLPMCGVPYHAAKNYIARLLKLGKKVAVCEQLTPAGKQKVMEREVMEIITPGTTVDEDFLEKGTSNYLCCLASGREGSAENYLSFSYIDLSTGEFFATSFSISEVEILRQELERLSIREMLVQESLLEEGTHIASAIYNRCGIVLNRWADWLFDHVQAKERLEKQFGLSNLKSFGLNEKSPEIISAGALLDYLDTTSKSMLLHIRTLKVYRDSEYLGLDESTQRNLELLANQRDGDVRFSLLEVMDETKCAMGRRLLKRRILHPLRDICKINSRLDMVEELYRDQGHLGRIRELLGKTPDLERLCSRLAMDKANGRDMLAIKNALVSFYSVIELVSPNIRFENVNDPSKNTNALNQVQNLLERGICEEPSILLNEGNLIKTGYNEELENLRDLRDKGRQFLEEYLEEERKKTGIASLKIRYNRMIGYFFEVTKAQLSRVPEYFIRRQGIVDGERYTTDRLAALESDINGASDKLVELEKKLFLEIREEVKNVLGQLGSAAWCLAELDVGQSLAKAASIRNWTRPVLNESTELEIYEGRHPVVEEHINRGEYIPNDIILNTDTANGKGEGISFAMITGPNMAGKSTYLRSAALITIMAQSGSFVPARDAIIGLCDRIYCRVGASDNLARGESTFLVEMNETAFILNTATKKSLVIMDEVGRGTGTNDGLSIAWAVSEELLNRIGCRTLFATHFHELSLLSHPHLANYSMEVQDIEGEIIFLRKLKEGAAAESYGIHVAQLAGLAENVLLRAWQIMDALKDRDIDLTETFQNEGFVQKGESSSDQIKNHINKKSNQGNVFPVPPPSQITKIEKQLLEVEPEQLTPLEALNLLMQWKKLIALDVPKQKQAKIRHLKEDDAVPSLFD